MELWYLIQVYSESVFEELFQELKILFWNETTFATLIIVLLTTYPELRFY
jgi:hypothetical protein